MNAAVVKPFTPRVVPRGVREAGAAPEPEFFDALPVQQADPAVELAAGLSAAHAQISPKFLYDRLGSALFTALTELPEYYPTRTEAAILSAHGPALEAALPPSLPLVDLGAGDGAKAARLFRTLGTRRYVAIDISQDYLHHALRALQQQFPDIAMTGVGLDFSQHLQLPPGVLSGPSLVFYPGSSIGNFAPDAALKLLSEARSLAQGGALLIGADLVKPAAVLEAAYDDALGVTAAFNLNMLRHVNRLLGSDFDVHQWQHRAVFNAQASRIEMHLQARCDLQVRWPGGARRFGHGAHIHTENSYKWTPAAFEALLRDAGWRGVRRFTDTQGWFGVFLAQG